MTESKMIKSLKISKSSKAGNNPPLKAIKSMKTNKSSNTTDAVLSKATSDSSKSSLKQSAISKSRSRKTARLMSKPTRSSTGSQHPSRISEAPTVAAAPHHDDKSADSMRVNQRLLTGVPEVDTTQKQFPIPVKKSRGRGKSGRRKRKTKEELLTVGPARLYGMWRCFLLDRLQLEARTINRYRVEGKKDSPCYIYDELHRYDSNTYYRNLMLGSCVGATIYFMTLIFVILPSTNEEFTLFKDQKFSISFIPIVLVAIFFVFVLRMCSYLYLSSYMIALIQILILSFTVLGNWDNDCRPSTNRTVGAYSTSVPLTGAGQLPVLAMASVEDSIGMEPDALRKALVWNRCDQSLKRYCSVNLLGELINFVLSIRLILI